MARGITAAAAGIGGGAVWNSRGAAAKCACAAAGFGNSGFGAGAVATSGAVDSSAAIGGAAACGGAARGAGSGSGCGATGAVRTLRRSPSIIASRSTTWPSVLWTASSESWVWRSVSVWL